MDAPLLTIEDFRKTLNMNKWTLSDGLCYAITIPDAYQTSGSVKLFIRFGTDPSDIWHFKKLYTVNLGQVLLKSITTLEQIKSLLQAVYPNNQAFR